MVEASSLRNVVFQKEIFLKLKYRDLKTLSEEIMKKYQIITSHFFCIASATEMQVWFDLKSEMLEEKEFIKPSVCLGPM